MFYDCIIIITQPPVVKIIVKGVAEVKAIYPIKGKKKGEVFNVAGSTVIEGDVTKKGSYRFEFMNTHYHCVV